MTVRRTASALQRIRQVSDLRPAAGISITPVATAGATVTLNAAVAAGGETAFGRAAWRLTTASLHASSACIRIDQTGPSYDLSPLIDPDLPIVMALCPHALNPGSRLRVRFVHLDPSYVSESRVSDDINISDLLLANESPSPVIPFMLDLTSTWRHTQAGTEPAGTAMSVTIQIFQNGTEGATDVTVLGLYQAQQTPMVHIGFDDGLYSVYQHAFPTSRTRARCQCLHHARRCHRRQRQDARRPLFDALDDQDGIG